MSRDRERPAKGGQAAAAPDRAGDRAAGAPGAGGADRAALLTAYVDGVAELPLDDRHAVEAWLAEDPDARAEQAAVQGLLGQLRDLPPIGDGGGEPDWAAMERSIRQAVAAEPMRPWWRRWQWLVPAMSCATAAAVLLVLWPRPAPSGLRPPHREGAPVTAPGTVDPAAAAATNPAANGDGEFALWLDGRVVDVDPAAAVELDSALGGEAGAGGGDADDTDDTGLLPASDLAWVDSLDDAALSRAEHWLDQPSSGDAGASDGHAPRGRQRKKS